MLKNRYVKKYLGWDYSLYNHGRTSKQAKRNRRLGKHIIRSRQKKEIKEMLKDI